MRRGVFALVLFLILSMILIDLYSMYSSFIENSLRSQGHLMDADEAFYLARNFEYDARYQLLNDRNFSHWKNFIYGIAGVECVQVSVDFKTFLNHTLSNNIFGGYGLSPACIVFPVEYKNFKTLGVLKSPVCLSNSSPSLLCSR